MTETHELLCFPDESHIDAVEESINQGKAYDHRVDITYSIFYFLFFSEAVICLISKLFILYRATA